MFINEAYPNCPFLLGNVSPIVPSQSRKNFSATLTILHVSSIYPSSPTDFDALIPLFHSHSLYFSKVTVLQILSTIYSSMPQNYCTLLLTLPFALPIGSFYSLNSLFLYHTHSTIKLILIHSHSLNVIINRFKSLRISSTAHTQTQVISFHPNEPL